LIRDAIKEASDKSKAQILQRYFKTGKGEYGEGDIFAGLTVPKCRSIALKFQDLPLSEVVDLLHSKIHEERAISLFILVLKYQKADEKQKEKIYRLYLNNTKFINNWDLVDLSCRDIVGAYVFSNPESYKDLINLTSSKLIWERRIAIIATYHFIKHKTLDKTFEISDLLMNNREDLIHKAVGWMLREAGQVNTCTTPDLKTSS
jgi:3-methyladenine DNA glycosylase AlkD